MILQELQRTVAVARFQVFDSESPRSYYNTISSTSTREFHNRQKLYNFFHGIGARLLVDGKGAYSELYLRMSRHVRTTADKEGLTFKNKRLLLKGLFSRLFETPIFGGGENISVDVLTANNSHPSSLNNNDSDNNDKRTLISGTTLYKMGEQGVHNVKKAISIAQSVLHRNEVDGHPERNELKHGNNFENLCETVLDQMFDLLEENSDDHDSDEEEDDDGMARDEHENESISSSDDGYDKKETNKVRPLDWMFPGYMAFVLFSPFAPNEQNRLKMFLNHLESVKQQEQDDDHLVDFRASPLEKKLRIALKLHGKIESDHSEYMRTFNRLLEAQTSKIEKLGIALDIAKVVCPVADEEDPYWYKAFRYQREIVELDHCMENLKERPHDIESTIVKEMSEMGGTSSSSPNTSRKRNHMD
eukprot:scaffold176427_cov44-Attheya_sp.AAC.3